MSKDCLDVTIIQLSENNFTFKAVKTKWIFSENNLNMFAESKNFPIFAV